MFERLKTEGIDCPIIFLKYLIKANWSSIVKFSIILNFSFGDELHVFWSASTRFYQSNAGVVHISQLKTLGSVDDLVKGVVHKYSQSTTFIGHYN